MAVEALPRIDCACASLRRAARAVTQCYEAALKESGLKVTQFTLLQALSLLGGASPQSALVKFLAIDATTLSRTLRPLALAGWIRVVDGADARETRWQLTPEGQRKVQRTRPAWERAQRRLRARLGKKTWTLLLEDLATVAAAAQE
ncbi:MAG TPA: MarR family winged helix-turn-helix transcriptional regulator [Gemmatimonadales bacterium]|nr:MarR family winged helix-turn-helix transcriptional regulator [Gemmatimonadales bacterium]